MDPGDRDGEEKNIAVDELEAFVEESEAFAEESDSDDDDADSNTLPDFILNALVNNIVKVNREGCPFEEYIELEGEAWSLSNESKHLIIRKNYQDLIQFVAKRFKSWRKGTLVHSTITGTAGIGKTMFALYLARKLVESNMPVVLYYGDRFWAFTKKEGKFSKKFLENTTAKNGIKIYYAAGSRNKKSELLHQLLEWPKVVVIRDCGKAGDKMKWIDTVQGRIVYIASSGQTEFLKLLENKFNDPVHFLMVNAKLWSSLDCVWGVKCGLLPGLENGIDDIAYVLEGYRRFGGSLRNVVRFAQTLKKANVGRDEAMDHPLPANVA